MTKDKISELTSEELLSESTIAEFVFSETDPAERAANEGFLNLQAKKLKLSSEFKAFLKACKHKEAALRGINRGNKTNFMNQPIQLNCGDWICDISGVRKTATSASGDFETKFASPIPILITEILENIDENTEKLRIAFYKNGWQSLICNRSTAASNTKIIELADYGLEVNSDNAKLLVKYLADLVSLNLDNIPRFKAVSKMGWQDSEFMPYSGTKFDGENEFKHLYETIRPKGDIDKWIEYTHILRKNKYLRLQMAASFAAPIIEKVNASCFILHFWGGTETGKTVGMIVAASIWANPVLGKYTYSLNNTQNTVMSVASFLNNLPVCCDELQSVRSKAGYDALVMQCTEGVGRGRMKYDKVQKLQTWKTAFIFTGEEPLTHDNSGGGTKNRVIEFECTEKVVENGNEVVRFVSENYGLVGEKYINCIKNEDLYEQYSEILKEILNAYDTSEKQAMAMACMLLADRLACKYIYTEEQPLEIDDVKEFLKTRSEVDNSERAYEFVLGLVAANANKFEKDSLEIWGKITDTHFFINKNILVREMAENGFVFDSVKSKWANSGYLIRNSQGRMIHSTKCYDVKSSYIKIALKDGGFYEIEEEAPF